MINNVNIVDAFRVFLNYGISLKNDKRLEIRASIDLRDLQPNGALHPEIDFSPTQSPNPTRDMHNHA